MGQYSDSNNVTAVARLLLLQTLRIMKFWGNAGKTSKSMEKLQSLINDLSFLASSKLEPAKIAKYQQVI